MIYRVECSRERDRAEIDFDDPSNLGIDWMLLDEIFRGKRNLADYRPIRLMVNARDAGSWKFYPFVGPIGMIAAETVERIGRDTLGWFTLVPARVDGLDYCILKPEAPLDCLDLTRSVVETIPGRPSRIVDVTVFAFKEGTIPDPVFFTIPQLGSTLLATEGIRERVIRMGARGFAFIALEVV